VACFPSSGSAIKCNADLKKSTAPSTLGQITLNHHRYMSTYFLRCQLYFSTCTVQSRPWTTDVCSLLDYLIHDAWTEDRRSRERLARARCRPSTPRPTHADRFLRTKDSVFIPGTELHLPKKAYVLDIRPGTCAQAGRRALRRRGSHASSLGTRWSMIIQRSSRSSDSRGRFTRPASLEHPLPKPQNHTNNPNTGNNTRSRRRRTEPAGTLTPPILRVRNNHVNQNAPKHRHREA
jgi:hypothetical protein